MINAHSMLSLFVRNIKPSFVGHSLIWDPIKDLRFSINTNQICNVSRFQTFVLYDRS